MPLRDYQVDLTDRVRSTVRTLRPPRRCLLQMETGGGKTFCAAELIRLCHEKGNPALFLARGRELVHQCSATLSEMGIPHGILMRGRGWSRDPIQVASKDTFLSWVVRRKLVDLPPADLVIPDEAHLSTSATWQEILGYYRKAVVVGLTATPASANGRGLGATYGALVCAVPTSKLIADGWLVPARAFAPYRPDLKGVRRDGNGDYDRKEAGKRMDRPQLVGDVVGHWKTIAPDRQTVVYGCTVEHALHLCEEFRSAGVKAAHVDGATETDLRDEILEQFGRGELQVITNVGVLQQGVDIPSLSCVVLARPTRSLVLFRQCCGRAKRPFPGKSECVLIDHSGSVYFHGHPDEDIAWELDEKVKIETKRAANRPPGEKEPLHCPNCHAIFARGPSCPNCGHKVQRRARAKEVKDGKLVEVRHKEEVTEQDRQRYWSYCLGVCANQGTTAAMAGMMYKRKFGEFPGEGGSGGLKNLPRPGTWRQSVAVLFPQFTPEGRQALREARGGQ